MPATPMPAATVILLRDGAISPEVLMIERHARSAFLPDMYVFPGGRIEPQDAALSDRVEGLTERGAAALLRTVDPDHAMAYVVDGRFASAPARRTRCPPATLPCSAQAIESRPSPPAAAPASSSWPVSPSTSPWPGAAPS